MARRLAVAMASFLVLTACGSGVRTLAPALPATTQSQFLFGWWGNDGRARALKTFSKEEGRAVSMLSDYKNARLEVDLVPAESALLRDMLTMPPTARERAAEHLPSGLKERALRHLK